MSIGAKLLTNKETDLQTNKRTKGRKNKERYLINSFCKLNHRNVYTPEWLGVFVNEWRTNTFLEELVSKKLVSLYFVYSTYSPIVAYMVLILDGNSEIGAHVWTDFANWTSLWQLFKSTAFSSEIKKYRFFFPSFVLPSD